MEKGSSTFSDGSRALARHWLNECSNNHQSCMSTAGSKCRPTRLIKIEPLPSGFQLFLDTTSRLETYITLSYCWGSKRPLRLLKSNLAKFVVHIAWESLPQVFKDAVVATSYLGIGFLWIDALCIIQDSQEDWYEQSTKMSEVYQNAWCNLSALDTEDSTEAMISPRIAKDHAPIFLYSECEDGPPQRYNLIQSDWWTQGVERAAVNRRAWVLQERLLARRILHFGRNQLFWECKVLRACEQWPAGRLLTDRQGWDPSYAHRLAQMITVGDGSQTQPFHQKNDRMKRSSEMNFVWGCILHRYTACNLTMPGDKLVAISGIVKQLQQAQSDEYFAGLWKREFIHSLLWLYPHGGRRPVTYRAPSWSWASLEGEAENHRPCTDCVAMASMESVKISSVTGDATGAIKEGILNLKCRTHPSFCHSRDGLSLKLSIESLDLPPSTGISESNSITAYADIDSTELPKNLLCAPLKYHNGSDKNTVFLKTAGLIIQPSPHQEGSYERVGMFEFEILQWSVPDDQPWQVLSYEVKGGSIIEIDNPDYPEQVITVI